MSDALASAAESPSRSRQVRVISRACSMTQKGNALISADRSPSNLKQVRITLPPRGEGNPAGKILSSPLKCRRQRAKTRVGQHYYKYPGWFCSPGCGPHCCGDMSEAIKDHYYAPGSSPKSTTPSPKKAHSLPEKSVKVLISEFEDLLSL